MKFQCEGEVLKTLRHHRISKQELQLLNTKCLDIVIKSEQLDQLTENGVFFKALHWSSAKKTSRYNPEMEEATLEMHQNKNQLLRELEHSTHKRKLKKMHKMNGEEIAYLEEYKKIQPVLSTIKKTLDTETTQKSEVPFTSSRLSKYPQLNKHPRLVNYINQQNDIRFMSLSPKSQRQQQDILIQGFTLPCKLIPIKSQIKPVEPPPLKVSQIIQAKYNNRYMKKSGETRINSEMIRNPESPTFKNLFQQQSCILKNNQMMSRENKQKLSESLDRILRLVSPKKIRQTPSPVLSQYQVKQRSFSVKLPVVQSLIKKRKK